MLSIVFQRPIEFTQSPVFSLEGLLVESVGLLISIYIIFIFYKRNGFYHTLTFFVPAFLTGAIIEGDWIVHQRYFYHKLNFYFWDTPIVIILYFSGIYLLFLLYRKLGSGFINKIKGLTIHLLIDSLVTTPAGIMFGFWTFRNMMFNHYPYIVPSIHIGEGLFGLFYVLFQERLLKTPKIHIRYKPIISLTVIFFLLLTYRIFSQFLDQLI